MARLLSRVGPPREAKTQAGGGTSPAFPVFLNLFLDGFFARIDKFTRGQPDQLGFSTACKDLPLGSNGTVGS